MSQTISSTVASATILAPPSTPGVNYYIVPATGSTGAWASYPNQIAWYENGAWRFATPTGGVKVWVSDTGVESLWNGVSWVSNANLLTNFTEYLSCNGTESNGGVAAATAYTPTTTYSSSGSAIPNVAITSTTATTNTTYHLTTQQTIRSTDLIFVEMTNSSASGWAPLTSYNEIATPLYWGSQGVFVGIQAIVTGPNTITVWFSNAGRITGSTIGSGSGNWSAAQLANYAWRVRHISQGNFAQQVPQDRLSPIANTEIQITAAATATIGCWHNCVATSANYAITLPPASSYSGYALGVRIDPSSTYLVTVTGNGSDLIDGLNTRVMWANEVAELKSNGSAWTKVGGKSIPMSATISTGVGGNQTFTASTSTRLNYTSLISSYAPASFTSSVSSSGYITAQRTSLYRVTGSTLFNGSNATASNTYLYIFINGVQQKSALAPAIPANTQGFLSIQDDFDITAGYSVALNGYYTTGSYITSFFYTNNTLYNRLTVTELPIW